MGIYTIWLGGGTLFLTGIIYFWNLGTSPYIYYTTRSTGVATASPAAGDRQNPQL